MKNKFCSAMAKKIIVEWVAAHPGCVSSQFDGGIDEAPALLEKNWKRMSRKRDEKFIVRSFDCRPYDDQLRAYVITNDADETVISVVIQGE